MQKLATDTEHQERVALIQQYLAQKEVITRSDLRSIHAYLEGTRGRNHATDSAV